MVVEVIPEASIQGVDTAEDTQVAEAEVIREVVMLSDIPEEGQVVAAAILEEELEGPEVVRVAEKDLAVVRAAALAALVEKVLTLLLLVVGFLAEVPVVEVAVLE